MSLVGERRSARPSCLGAGQRLGRYCLQESLGQGGMGQVWRAHDEHLKRDVALKLMAPLAELSERVRQRFQREAETVARLRSPHVVEVYDVSLTDDGTPYIVMELLEGEDLGRRLRRVRTLGLDGVAAIVEAVSRGLSASHRAGVVHRDLKPANVFIAHFGADTQIKVLDFGVALMHSEGHAERLPGADDQTPGTPAYMSPEQILHNEVDHRADLWALAVLAYESLTGHHPFGHGAGPSVMLRICTQTPLLPSALNPALGTALDGFFARALDKDPTQRFQDAEAFRLEFQRVAVQGRVRGHRALVVDDEPDTQLLIEQCFEEAIESGEYEFIFAPDGAAALRLLDEVGGIDVALTDLNMPVLDGFEFMERAQRIAPTMKSVVVTAYGDLGNVRRAMNRGAFDFLLKPIDMEDLACTLGKAAREARALGSALKSATENAALRTLLAEDVVQRVVPLLQASRGIALDTCHGVAMSLRVVMTVDQTANRTVEVLDRCFDIIVTAAERHAASVVRFFGDSALLVLRGHEPERQAMQLSWQIGHVLTLEPELSGAVRVCIGLDAGPVTAATVGSPSRRRFDYSLLGEVVRRARCLESLARPSEILVTERVRMALDFEVNCASVGDRALQESSGAVFRVIGQGSDGQVSGAGAAAPGDATDLGCRGQVRTRTGEPTAATRQERTGGR